MDLRQLRTLVAIAEEGSLAGAAARLHLVQSGLSRQIKDLESEIGVLLFVRTATGVRPTDAGLEAIRLARQVLCDVEVLPEQVRSVQPSAKRLHIGCIGGAFGNWIPQAILRIKEHRPDVLVSVTEAHTPAVVAGVQSGEFDLGVVSRTSVAGLKEILLYEEALVLLASRNSRWQRLSSVHLPEIAGERLVLYPPNHSLRKLVDAAFAHRGIQPLVALEAESPRVICQSIDLGIGLAIVTENFMLHHGNSNLVSVPICDRHLRRRQIVLIAGRDLSDGDDSPSGCFLQSICEVLGTPGAVSGRICLPIRRLPAHDPVRTGSAEPQAGLG